MSDEEGVEEEHASLWVWIILIVTACISFWLQATVTEERFVPALNVIANHYNIPDDIAGATLMAAGASSPELFSSFVALFITHSSLGLGTIVGSEIFNQLIICAGAVYSAKTVGLRIDPAIVTREVGFYALSIILLYFALQDTRPDPDDDSGENHIYISFYEALYVFGGYIAYVIVCAKMDTCVAFAKSIFPKSESQNDLKSTDADGTYGAIPPPIAVGETSKAQRVSLGHVEDGRMPFLRESSLMKREPVGNFETVEFYRTRSGQSHPGSGGNETGSLRSMASAEYRHSVHSAKSMGKYSDGSSLRRLKFLMHKEKPSDDHGLYDLEYNEAENRLSCFMWQRSYFYNKARLAIHGWHLRWFTIKGDSVYSLPDRADSEKHRITYPAFRQIEVDEKRLIIRIINPIANRRSYYLLAQSHEIFDAVVSRLEKIMDTRQKNSSTDQEEDLLQAPADSSMAEDGHESLIEVPIDITVTGLFFFTFLYPFRLLLHWTIPDVRVFDGMGNPVSTLGTAYIAVVACLIWLIIGSYAMVSSLENLAELLDIPNAVIGVTVSAAGTSLPNYVASKIAAEKGFGNMAVSNAFGSNTFNIMIGLGLPWLLYTSFGTGFQPYHGLRDEGITESVIILGSVLLVFILAVLQSGFVLYRWHAILFIIMYVAYIVYEIARVYL